MGIWFAETFERAARYAVDERGGETIALVGRAMNDIAEEIRNPECIRARLHEKRTNLHETAIRSGFSGEESWDNANPTSDSFKDIDHALSVLECPHVLFSELHKVPIP